MAGIRWFLAAAAAAAVLGAAPAAADEAVAQTIFNIESEFQRAASDLAANSKGASVAADYEKLGAAALAKLDALAATLKAGGPAKAGDLALVYEAMLFPGIAPSGEGAWALTAKNRAFILVRPALDSDQVAPVLVER